MKKPPMIRAETAKTPEQCTTPGTIENLALWLDLLTRRELRDHCRARGVHQGRTKAQTVENLAGALCATGFNLELRIK